MTQTDKVITDLNKVVADLQARADYTKVKFTVSPSSTVTAGQAVTDFQQYKQLLMNKAATKSTDPVDSTGIQALIAAIIHSNIEMMNMGQLSTARTIMPTVASKNNIHLKSLQDNIMILDAGGSSDSSRGPNWNGGTNWQHPSNSVEISWKPTG